METQGLWDWLIDASVFVRRNQCGTGWTAALENVHRVSDLAIGLSYLAIPSFLWSFVLLRQKRSGDVPRSLYVFTVFATLFIVTCGLTHLFAWLAFVYPVYRADAAMKVLCAICSWGTVAALPMLILQALNLPSRKQFEDKADALVAEGGMRAKVESELRVLNGQLLTQVSMAREILSRADKESKSVEDGLRDLIKRMEDTSLGNGSRIE